MFCLFLNISVPNFKTIYDKTVLKSSNFSFTSISGARQKGQKIDCLFSGDTHSDLHLLHFNSFTPLLNCLFQLHNHKSINYFNKFNIQSI